MNHTSRKFRANRRAALGLFAVIVLFMASACSSSDDSSGEPPAGSSTPATLSGSTTRGITDTSVNLGGLINAQFAESAVGAQARLKLANDAGGVNGRQINWVGSYDDNSDPAANLSAGRKLVQADEAFAVIAMSGFMQASQVFQEDRVPFFGWGISPLGFCEENGFGFSFSGCGTPTPPVRYAQSTWGALLNEYLVSSGDSTGAEGKTAAIIVEDCDACRVTLDTARASLESVGFDVVYAESPVPSPPATVGDFSPYASAVLSSSSGAAPDVILSAMSFQNTLPFQQAVEQAGYEGLVTNALQYDPRVVQAAKDILVLTPFATAETEQSNPQMAEIVDSIRAYDPAAVLSLPTLAGWFSADMFLQALEAAGPNPTAESVQAAASTMTYGIDGVVGPITYPTGWTQPAPCGQLVQSDGANYSIVAPYDCFNVITL